MCTRPYVGEPIYLYVNSPTITILWTVYKYEQCLLIYSYLCNIFAHLRFAYEYIAKYTGARQGARKVLVVWIFYIIRPRRQEQNINNWSIQLQFSPRRMMHSGRQIKRHLILKRTMLWSPQPHHSSPGIRTHFYSEFMLAYFHCWLVSCRVIVRCLQGPT